MRVVKNPDTRKQEILDCAIELFAEKGYERTSISDIAKALNISQGLCYRYYLSKEEIYNAAIEEYSDLIVRKNLKRHDINKSVKQLIIELTESSDNFIAAEKENKDLFRMFHSADGKRMHNELFISVIKKYIPYFKETLVEAQKRGEIKVEDLESTATFCLYGMMGMFLNESLSDAERMKKIRESWFSILGIE